MDIILYKTKTPNNYLTKTLYNQIQLTGSLRDESNVINPDILIEHENLSKYNYMYIPDFKRFYYIKEVTSIRTGLWRLSGHVDVLNTYRAEISQHEVIIEKQFSTDKSNLYYDDGSFVVENRQYMKLLNFSDGLDEKGEYILITAGNIAG